MSFSFKTWPFPSPKKNTHLLKCSKFGLIAHAINNEVAIYAEEFGHYTPLLMWSPFQHQIAAMEWYDASKTTNTTVPVLVLSSVSGRLEVFDCRSRISIFRSRVNLNEQSANDPISAIQYPTPTIISHSSANSKREGDYVTCITWSQFSSSCFFVGTKNGRLLRFEITIGQIVKCRVVWELFFDFQIDYICIEPQFGEICAIASEKGSIVTIQNINKDQEGKPPETSPNVVTLLSKADSIHEIKFYPTSTEFLILVTTSNSLLYSITECCTAPLLMLPGIRKYHILHDTGNIALIVRDDSVELWKSMSNQNKRLAEAKMITSPKYSNQREIVVSDMVGDKLVFITSQMWLTTVEVKFSSKLFITHRVKLLDSKPLSFSYANESIAIATVNGNVLVSETSNPNFIAQMTYKVQNQPKLQDQDNSSFETTEKRTSNEDSQKRQVLRSPESKSPNSNKLGESQTVSNQTNSTNLPSFTSQNTQSSKETKNSLNLPSLEIPTIDNNNATNSSNIPGFNEPSFTPSPLSGISVFDSTNQGGQNPTLNSDFDQNAYIKQKLSSSKSQDIRQLLSSDIGINKPTKGNKSPRSPNRRNRVRKSIIKSCASSSSLFLDTAINNPQEEVILDKSIVVDNQQKQSMQQQQQTQNSPKSLLVPSSPDNSPKSGRISFTLNQSGASVINDANQGMMTKVPTNVSRKRRFSSNPSEGLKNTSILSRVVDEGIKTMPKDSSSVQVVGSSKNSVPSFGSSNQNNKNYPIPTPTLPTKSPVNMLNLGNETPKTEEHPLSPSLTGAIPNLQPVANVPLNRISSDKILSPTVNDLPEDQQKSSFPQVPSKVVKKFKFGNNCTIMWNYKIGKDEKIEHIEWIASTRVMAYTLAKKVQEKEDVSDKLVKKLSKDKFSNDSSESLDNQDTAQRFSGKSFIYLIDFKYHRMTQLFDKPGINITSVTFSANKQYFFVTINGFMAVLFKNKLKPQKIQSFTFNKTIYVTFIPFYLVMADGNGELIFSRMKEKEEDEQVVTKRQIKMKKEYGNITCVFGRKYIIYMGTSTGYVITFDTNSMHTTEVLQMKASIVQFKSGPSGSFCIEDAKGNMMTIASDGETTQLPSNIKFAIMASPTTLLIRRKKSHTIEVYQTIGQYNPAYPKAAVRCPMMMPSNRWVQSLLKEDQIDQNVLINYGMVNIASLLNARKSPNFTYEQISFLRDLIMDTPQLWKTSYRLSIFLRDFEAAHTIIAINTVPSNTDKDWAINMMKCALFVDDVSIKENQVESILFASTSLIKNGFINDGVDILLAAGLWIDAVKILMQLGKNQEAATITRVYRDENSLNVVNDISSKLFQVPNMVPYALTMLCEVGLDDVAINELEALGQYYAAYILKMVNDNESLNV